MLTIEVLLSEDFDESKDEFVSTKFVLSLEHSLVSLSKWELEFEKPFLGKTEKTKEEVIAYIKAMILNPDYPPDIFESLTKQNFDEIQRYIDAKQTATWFYESKNKPQSREQITSEVIYYWITSYQIPWEVQHWHLNRLFTLIRVFHEKNEPKKPRGRAEMAAERQRLNAQRRAQLGTRG